MVKTTLAAQDMRVSWGSIFGGVVTALAVSFLLSLLGSGLGLSAVDISAAEAPDGMGTGILIYTGLSVLISLALGGYIAGRLSVAEGRVHGFLAWAVSVLLAVILSGVLVNSAFNAASSIAGSVVSATGSVASGAGSLLGKGASGAADLVKNAFGDINIDTHSAAQNTDQKVQDVLRKSGIAQLQPEYLSQQLEAVKNDVAQAGKKLVQAPDSLDAIFKELVEKIKARGQDISKEIDKDKLAQAFKNNTDMTDEEAAQAADNVIRARNETVKTVQEGINNVNKQIEEAKVKLEQAKQQALEQAEKAKKAVAKASIWSFVSLLIAAILSAFTGHLGAARARNRLY
ncbi:hypothetical protein ACVFVO_18415 [Advenella kashmirensis]